MSNVVFVRSAEELSDRFRRGGRILDPFGGLWVCTIDADGSGLRFVVRKENRLRRKKSGGVSQQSLGIRHPSS